MLQTVVNSTHIHRHHHYPKTIFWIQESSGSEESNDGSEEESNNGSDESNIGSEEQSSESQTCHGKEPWLKLDEWCTTNCNHTPPFCPETHCTCI